MFLVHLIVAHLSKDSEPIRELRCMLVHDAHIGVKARAVSLWSKRSIGRVIVSQIAEWITLTDTSHAILVVLHDFYVVYPCLLHVSLAELRKSRIQRCHVRVMYRWLYRHSLVVESKLARWKTRSLRRVHNRRYLTPLWVERQIIWTWITNFWTPWHRWDAFHLVVVEYGLLRNVRTALVVSNYGSLLECHSKCFTISSTNHLFLSLTIRHLHLHLTHLGLLPLGHFCFQLGRRQSPSLSLTIALFNARRVQAARSHILLIINKLTVIDTCVAEKVIVLYSDRRRLVHHLTVGAERARLMHRRITARATIAERCVLMRRQLIVWFNQRCCSDLRDISLFTLRLVAFRDNVVNSMVLFLLCSRAWMRLINHFPLGKLCSRLRSHRDCVRSQWSSLIVNVCLPFSVYSQLNLRQHQGVETDLLQVHRARIL